MLKTKAIKNLNQCSMFSERMERVQNPAQRSNKRETRSKMFTNFLRHQTQKKPAAKGKSKITQVFGFVCASTATCKQKDPLNGTKKTKRKANVFSVTVRDGESKRETTWSLWLQKNWVKINPMYNIFSPFNFPKKQKPHFYGRISSKTRLLSQQPNTE